MEETKLNEPVVLNPVNTANALDVLCEWFPGEAPQLNKYRAEIIACAVNNFQLPAASPLLNLTFISSRKRVEVPPPAFEITDCMKDICEASIYASVLVLDLLRIKIPGPESYVTTIVKSIKKEGFIAVYTVFKDFLAVQDRWGKAKLFFKIFIEIYNLDIVQRMIEIWMETATWFDWLKLVVTAIAQFFIWFASEGLALIAQIASTILAASDLIASIQKVSVSCFNDDVVKDNAIRFKPEGLYLAQAKNVKVNLQAMFPKKPGPGGNMVSLDISGYPINAIFNYDGEKIEMKGKSKDSAATKFSTILGDWSKVQYSYIDLIATIPDKDGNMKESSLDVRSYPVTSTFKNVNGNLSIDKWGTIEKDKK